MMIPLLLQPALHTRVWGGRRLETVLHKTLPTAEPYGEAWELHDTSVILNGADAGRTLGDLIPEAGAALIGTGNDPAQGFPLLAKIIDAADWLSIQVHPDDAFAAQLEGEPRGKTEAWYVMDATPGAKLVCGVQPGTTREAMAAAIAASTLEDLVVYAEVQTGDGLYMEAGAIHALGPGLLIYEIQQSSNTTYRLYDWGRVGLDGKPRPLHIEQSLTVAKLEMQPQITRAPETGTTTHVFNGPYFVTLRHTLHGDSLNLNTTGEVFHALTCIAGQFTVSAGTTQVSFATGQTVLVPAAVGAYALTGTGTVLNSMQRDTVTGA